MTTTEQASGVTFDLYSTSLSSDFEKAVQARIKALTYTDFTNTGKTGLKDNLKSTAAQEITNIEVKIDSKNITITAKNGSNAVETFDPVVSPLAN
jgi:hypothetical protein